MSTRHFIFALLIFAAGAARGAEPGLCRLLFLAFSHHDVVYGQNRAADALAPARDEALADYESRYTAKPAAGDDLARVQLLHRLGVLRGPAPTEVLPPRIVATKQSARAHGGGGTYTRFHDQYGDIYGTSIDGVSTFPEFSRVFNVPRLQPGLPDAPARFLREAAGDFPLDKLSTADLHLLEPLPQTDPLRSYLGCALMRVYTKDRDKPMPPYSAEIKSRLTPGGNYFRRTDGTYYIYDLPNRRLIDVDFRTENFGNKRYDVHRENFERIVEAIRGAPDKAKAIDFYLDSLYAFPAIGREQIRNHIAREASDLAAHEASVAAYRDLEKSPVFRFFRSLAGRRAPRPPRMQFEGPYSYTRLVEGYFLMPLYVEMKHWQLAPELRDPDLLDALRRRNEQYRATLLQFIESIEKELPPRIAKALREHFTLVAEEKPLPRGNSVTIE